MSNETKSPASEKSEPQKITPQTGEIDAEKLDEVSGGNQTASGTPTLAPPPPAPVG